MTSPRASGTPGASVLLLIAVLVVGVNLRGAIAAVSPVLPEIRADLEMAGATAGLLTTLPVLCFALVAPAAAWLGRHIGTDRSIVLACLLIAAGTVWRSGGGSATILAGTVVIGAAMTVGNVLLPEVIKREFPHRGATVTGLFTAALITGAAMTAALTAPLASQAGWRVALAGWSALAVIGAVAWQVAARRRPDTPPMGVGVLPGTPDEGHERMWRVVWRSPIAWAIALLLGAQAAGYFVVTAWLPTFLVSQAGIDLETGGAAMAMFQILGLGGTVLISSLATVRRQQGWLAGCIAGGWTVTVVGLLVWPTAWPVWTVFGGIAQGAGIALALTLIVLRSRDSAVARELSAMAQLVGYLVGAVGPVAAGLLFELTGSWTTPWLLLLVLAALMGVAGMIAGRDVSIGGGPREG